MKNYGRNMNSFFAVNNFEKDKYLSLLFSPITCIAYDHKRQSLISSIFLKDKKNKKKSEIHVPLIFWRNMLNKKYFLNQNNKFQEIQCFQLRIYLFRRSVIELSKQMIILFYAYCILSIYILMQYVQQIRMLKKKIVDDYYY